MPTSAAEPGSRPRSVHDRVRKLERSGAIRGYRAIVDPDALGLFVDGVDRA